MASGVWGEFFTKGVRKAKARGRRALANLFDPILFYSLYSFHIYTRVVRLQVVADIKKNKCERHIGSGFHFLIAGQNSMTYLEQLKVRVEIRSDS